MYTFRIIAGAHVLVLVSTFLFLPKDVIKKPVADPVQDADVAVEPEAGVELIEVKGNHKGKGHTC